MKLSKKFKVEFYSDFSQLKYVFAEVITKTEIKDNEEETQNDNNKQKSIRCKTKDIRR